MAQPENILSTADHLVISALVAAWIRDSQGDPKAYDDMLAWAKVASWRRLTGVGFKTV